MTGECEDEAPEGDRAIARLTVESALGSEDDGAGGDMASEAWPNDIVGDASGETERWVVSGAIIGDRESGLVGERGGEGDEGERAGATMIF